jgi:hypothetical protein
MLDCRRAAAFLFLLPLLVSGCASGLAASPPTGRSARSAGSTGDVSGSVSVEGILIDTHCYSLDRAYASDDHRTPGGTIEGCAEACARLGIPVGLLTDSGEVVVLLAPSTDLAEHMGREARAVGPRVLGALRPDSVSVRDSSGAWTAVPIHQMM